MTKSLRICREGYEIWRQPDHPYLTRRQRLAQRLIRTFSKFRCDQNAKDRQLKGSPDG